MEIDYRLLVNLLFVFHMLLALTLLLGRLPICVERYCKRFTALVGARLVGLYESGHDALIMAALIGQLTYCHCPLVVLEMSLRTRYNPDLDRQIESAVAPWLNQILGLQLAPEIPTVLYLLSLYLLFFVASVTVKRWKNSKSLAEPVRARVCRGIDYMRLVVTADLRNTE